MDKYCARVLFLPGPRPVGGRRGRNTCSTRRSKSYYRKGGLWGRYVPLDLGDTKPKPTSGTARYYSWYDPTTVTATLAIGDSR